MNSDGFVGSSVATGALAQSGTTVTGTLTFTSGCIATAQLTGTVSQNSVNFKLSEPDQLASFTGTLTAKFLSASGSWTALREAVQRELRAHGLQRSEGERVVVGAGNRT